MFTVDSVYGRSGRIEQVSKRDNALLGGVLLPLFVLSAAAFVYGMYGFDAFLFRDSGIYFYGGQRMAEGVPPYVSIFDHKGPLPVAFAGLGVVLSGWFGIYDLYSVRLVFYAIGCLTTVVVYLLGREVFRAQIAGLFGALTFLGFYGYARPVASGPEPKTPLVLFQALCLVFLVRKNWFWAGFSGSVAFLAWQPAGILLAVSLLLAVGQPGRERPGALLRAGTGVATPLAATVLYYWYHGALEALLDGFLVFNLFLVDRAGQLPLFNPQVILNQMMTGYNTMVLPILVGLAVILSLYFRRPVPHRFVPVLLSLPLFVLWSLTDFQVPEDFYVFLPYAAIGFGAALALAVGRVEGQPLVVALFSVALIGAALTGIPEVNQKPSPGPSLQEQRRSVAEIERRFGEDVSIASINAPQVLALMQRTNPNRYLFITDGIDNQIEADVPGGFEGWVRSLQEYDPELIAYYADGQFQMPDANLSPERREQLYSWLDANYRAEKIGNFWVYVRNQPPPEGGGAP